MGIFLLYLICEKNLPFFFSFLTYFMARDSAEASVDLTEASVSAESRFRAIRSFTSTSYTLGLNRNCEM